jgi:hypothetical protein
LRIAIELSAGQRARHARLMRASSGLIPLSRRRESSISPASKSGHSSGCRRPNRARYFRGDGFDGRQCCNTRRPEIEVAMTTDRVLNNSAFRVEVRKVIRRNCLCACTRRGPSLSRTPSSECSSPRTNKLHAFADATTRLDASTISKPVRSSRTFFATAAIGSSGIDLFRGWSLSPAEIPDPSVKFDAVYEFAPFRLGGLASNLRHTGASS